MSNLLSIEDLADFGTEFKWSFDPDCKKWMKIKKAVDKKVRSMMVQGPITSYKVSLHSLSHVSSHWVFFMQI